MECLFCGFPESGYKPEVEREFICSRCTQLLLTANQEDLNRAHINAIEKGFLDKTRAIESFLIPKETNDRETKQARRNMGRKRPLRTVRLNHNQLRT
jgi:hypothetical protein